MLRGRIEREVKQYIIAKGLPFNEAQFQRLTRKKYEELANQNKENRPEYKTK